MDVIDQLMNEHRQVERALQEFQTTVASLRTGDLAARAQLTALVAFFAGFADTIHHGKEEELLFRRLCERGFSDQTGPVAVMLAEHEQGRKLVGAMGRQIDGGDVLNDAEIDQLTDSATRYISLLRDHIRKADQKLYVLARGVLPTYGYVKQACKIAGMRQPRAWSTG